MKKLLSPKSGKIHDIFLNSSSKEFLSTLTVHWQANGDYTFLNDKLEQLRTIDRLAKYYGP